MSGGNAATQSGSLTDTREWRDFCAAATADLSLLDSDPDGVLQYVLGTKAQAEERYRLIADRLERLFGPAGALDVFELGGGYGGMAAELIRRGARCMGHDLPEAFDLQAAYLRSLGFRYEPYYPNLFFSAYALSELHPVKQRRWLKEAALYPHGYVVWNGWLREDPVPVAEYLQAIPGSFTLAEDPPSHERNVVVCWGAR